MNAQPAGWYKDPNDPSLLRYWSGTAWTEARAPRDQARVPAATPLADPRTPTGKWYFVITLASAGLFAAVPFFHAASRLGRPQLRKTGASLAAGSLVGYALIGLSSTDANGEPTGWLSNVAAIILLAVMLVASLLLIGLRREVYESSTAGAPASGNLSAMASVEEDRRKRSEARKLAAKDPLMARELRIGRPDTGQGYDDGGLLDLNLATAEQLSAICGLPRALAEEVVASRAALGRFVHVEDAIVFGQVSEDYAPMIRDRGIIITDR